jgi:hypothetical protein
MRRGLLLFPKTAVTCGNRFAPCRLLAVNSGAAGAMVFPDYTPILLLNCNTHQQPFVESPQRLKSRQMPVFFASLS